MNENGQLSRINSKYEKKMNNLIYLTEDGFSISKYLNSSKDKLIFKITFPEVRNYYYSKELDYEDITKIYPIFSIEDDILEIDKLITESINNYGAKTLYEENDEKKMYLVIPIKINSKIKEIKIELMKINYNQEDFYASIAQKLNDLLDERKEIYGVKSFRDIKNEIKIEKDDFLEKIENKYEKVNIIYNILKENNLLAISNIISNSEEVNLILNTLKKIEIENNRTTKNNISYLYQSTENIIFKLVYRATRDGDSSRDFHNKCDKIGPNITLLKTNNNVKFGGFTNCNWGVPENAEDKKNDVQGVQKSDPDSFCFSLTSKKIYLHNIEKDGAIFCSNKYGPTFSDNIFAVNNKMLSKGGYCTKKEKSFFVGQKKDYEISGGEKTFQIKELEIFEIIAI